VALGVGKPRSDIGPIAGMKAVVVADVHVGVGADGLFIEGFTAKAQRRAGVIHQILKASDEVDFGRGRPDELLHQAVEMARATIDDSRHELVEVIAGRGAVQLVLDVPADAHAVSPI